MRPIPAALLLLASACGSPGAPAPQDDARAPADSPAGPANVAVPAANAAIPPEDPPDPGVAGMSPSQRRAYERGYRDCGTGRYEPDRHSEAYRIGCAAAQDR